MSNIIVIFDSMTYKGNETLTSKRQKRKYNMSKKQENYNELAVEFQNTKTHTSFTRLYYKMRPGLKFYILKFVKDGDVTEDLLARTFEKIYRKIDTYKPEYSITTWAYSIARRECIRWIKRERNKKVSLSYFNENGGEVVESEGISQISLGSMIMEPDDYITENEAWKDEGTEITKYDLTVKAINSLKPMYREILVDNLFNGMKYKEIAYKLEPDLGELSELYDALNIARENGDEEFEVDGNTYNVKEVTSRNGKMSPSEEKKFMKYYKTILQRVKNRVRRGKMIVESDVNSQMAKMDI